MSSRFALRGVITPLLTPLTEGGDALDEGALLAHVQWLIEKGVHGVMPCGSTGEGALLSNAERRRVVEVTLRAAAGRVPVLAHTGTATTAGTVALARHAQSCGVDAVSVVTPYYFHLADAALVAHYCRVAEAVAPTPVYLYNIPQNTGNTLTAEVAQGIVARCPNVLGVKDSSGDLAALRAFLKVNGGRFQVVCGNDILILRALEEGACASVSGNANVYPEVVVGLFDAFWRGHHEDAQRRQQELDHVRRLLGKGDSLSLMKRALTLRGLHGGYVRPPLLEASDEMLSELEESLRSLSLLR